MKKIITIVLVTIALLSCTAPAYADYHKSYVVIGVVVDLIEDEDLVIVRDFNGEEWGFYEIEDWVIGDIVRMTMNDMGTASIYDDEILSTIYIGWINLDKI